MSVDKNDLGKSGENFVFMRNQFTTSFFQNGMVSTFGNARADVAAEITQTDEKMHYVVIINHLERQYFISHTKDLRAYLRGVAGFLVGSKNYCASVDLQRARNEKNLAYWCAEVLKGNTLSVAEIRAKLEGWTELGSKIHKVRLGGGDVVFYKIIHDRTGWTRYASHRADREPTIQYIATQALIGILNKLRRDRKMPLKEKMILDHEYADIMREIEKDPSCIRMEVISEVNKEKVNYRPIDMVRDINIALEQEWLNSAYVKKLLEK
jgi:hypothetical protein